MVCFTIFHSNEYKAKRFHETFWASERLSRFVTQLGFCC